MGFVPGMVSSTFDSAPAATRELVQQATAGSWWTPVTAGLYPGFFLLRLVQDPVFLACLAIVVCIARLARSSRVGAGLAQ